MMPPPVQQFVVCIGAMRRRLHPRLVALIVPFWVVLLPPYALAWNSPGHMVSGSIAYQLLRAESPATIAAIKPIFDKHPWYPNQWKKALDKISESQRDETLFMLATRWADEIRRGPDKAQHRRQWHYIN